MDSLLGTKPNLFLFPVDKVIMEDDDEEPMAGELLRIGPVCIGAARFVYEANEVKSMVNSSGNFSFNCCKIRNTIDI